MTHKKLRTRANAIFALGDLLPALPNQERDAAARVLVWLARSIVTEQADEPDPMYDQAVQLVADTRRCSTSWLQRKLMLGYDRAARIVQTMEACGIVGPARGDREREVLVARSPEAGPPT